MNGDPKKSQALEALGKVREAEERARAIVLEARDTTAVQIAKEAAGAAERVKQQAFARVKVEAEARKRAALEAAQKGADAVRAETRAELENLRRRAEASLDEAVRTISLKIKETLEKGSV